MLQWILDHYHILIGWGSTAGLSIWAWFSAHNGQLRKVFRAIRQLLHLRTQLRVTTEQLTIARTEAAQERARAEQLAADNDKLTKLLKPPERRHELEDKLLVLAARKKRVVSSTLQRECGVHSVTSQFHHQQLLDAGLLQRLGQANPYSFLTHDGMAYLIRNDLVPEPDTPEQQRNNG